MEVKNAVIKSVSLTTADHGCLSAWLHLDYGGSGQGFGGYALYLPSDWKHHTGQSAAAGHFITRCLQVAGVEEWKDLVGKTIRVKANLRGIEAIGHILKEDWFNPKEEFLMLENNNGND